MRWTNWMRVLQERMEDPGSPGEGGTGGEPEVTDPSKSKETPTPSNPSATGIESPFRGTRFDGMSVEDVASRFTLMEATVKEQGSALTDLYKRAREGERSPPAASAAPAVADPEFDAQTFFADPAKVLKARDEHLASRIVEDMKTLIAPFSASFKKNEIASNWDAAERRLPDFARYRPYIENVLETRGIDDPTEDTLEMLYYTAVGKAAINGGAPPAVTAATPATPTPTESVTRVNPQHPPSSQPIKPTSSDKKIRPLTENEKRIARMNNMTDEEYLSWLEVDEEDIVSSKIGSKA